MTVSRVVAFDTYGYVEGGATKYARKGATISISDDEAARGESLGALVVDAADVAAMDVHAAGRTTDAEIALLYTGLDASVVPLLRYVAAHPDELHRVIEAAPVPKTLDLVFEPEEYDVGDTVGTEAFNLAENETHYGDGGVVPLEDIPIQAETPG